jgi:hypothetical protein
MASQGVVHAKRISCSRCLVTGNYQTGNNQTGNNEALIDPGHFDRYTIGTTGFAVLHMALFEKVDGE